MSVVKASYLGDLSPGEKVFAGDVRESNPGPLAPKARIIPLDQHPLTMTTPFPKGIETMFRLRDRENDMGHDEVEVFRSI